MMPNRKFFRVIPPVLGLVSVFKTPCSVTVHTLQNFYLTRILHLLQSLAIFRVHTSQQIFNIVLCIIFFYILHTVLDFKICFDSLQQLSCFLHFVIIKAHEYLNVLTAFKKATFSIQILSNVGYVPNVLMYLVLFAFTSRPAQNVSLSPVQIFILLISPDLQISHLPQ
jgi:hypothetical protein